MILNWKKSESLVQPLEVDCTLSTTGVFYRKNIVAIAGDDDTPTKYVYDEVVLPEEFRFPILDVEEYKLAIQEKLNELNAKLHITKLDFYKLFCEPVGITYDALLEKITELNMKAEWELCNHVYYGVIKPFLTVLPLGKTEEEIVAIFEENNAS